MHYPTGRPGEEVVPLDLSKDHATPITTYPYAIRFMAPYA